MHADVFLTPPCVQGEPPTADDASWLSDTDMSLALERADGSGRAAFLRLALVMQEEVGDSNWKHCVYQRQGYASSGMCTTYRLAHDICGVYDPGQGRFRSPVTGAAVDPSADPAPAWDSGAVARVGCDPTTRWSPVRWLALPAPNDGSFPSLPSTTAPEVVVRIAGDPLLAALDATNGSLDVLAGSAYAATVGYALLATGLALLVPALVLLAVRLTKSSDRAMRRGSGGRYQAIS